MAPIYLCQCHQPTTEDDGSVLLSGLISFVRLRSPIASEHIALGTSFVAWWNNESRWGERQVSKKCHINISIACFTVFCFVAMAVIQIDWSPEVRCFLRLLMLKCHMENNVTRKALVTSPRFFRLSQINLLEEMGASTGVSQEAWQASPHS